jgi:hypothetical protein
VSSGLHRNFYVVSGGREHDHECVDDEEFDLAPNEGRWPEVVRAPAVM